jgi:hypothetical protein
VALPLGSWAERSGLLVNVDGIVQEIRRVGAVGPADLMPLVEFLEEVLLELDPAYEVKGREGIVAELAAVGGLAGLDFPTVHEDRTPVGGGI